MNCDFSELMLLIFEFRIVGEIIDFFNKNPCSTSQFLGGCFVFFDDIGLTVSWLMRNA